MKWFVVPNVDPIQLEQVLEILPEGLTPEKVQLLPCGDKITIVLHEPFLDTKHAELDEKLKTWRKRERPASSFERHRG